MKIRTLLFILTLLFVCSYENYAQMTLGAETYYGNEWMEPGKEYFKIEISEDGVYKLNASDLEEGGLSLSAFDGADLALIHLGKSIPIYTSNDGRWSSEDFLLFRGERNKAFLDQFMYSGGMDWVLNQDYSLINDVAAYYIVVDKASALRYTYYENVADENLEPKSWHRYVEKMEFNEEYHKDYRKAAGVSYYESHFVRNEGWASRNLRTHNLDFNPDAVVLDSLEPEVHIRLISDYNDHELTLRINNDTAYHQVMNRFELLDKSFKVGRSQIRKNRVRFRVRGEIDGQDRYRVVSASIKYSRATSSIDSLTFADSLTQNRYYAITNLESSRSGWGFSGQYIFNTIPEGDKQVVNATGLPEGEFMEVYGSDAIKKGSIISQIQYKDYEQYKDVDLIFLTARDIEKNVPSLYEYKEYRESVEGGGFRTEIVFVEDLYEHFGYGVARHSMALKNFLFYLDHIGSDLEFVFLVGKGIQHTDARTVESFQSPIIQEFRVPSFGFPSSDDLLCSPTNRMQSMYSVGRLAFNTENEIALYLDKVKVNERHDKGPEVEKNIWQKRLIHLNAGGGGEYQVIDGHFNRMKRISEDSPVSPDITTYRKTSNTPIQFTEIESIFKDINKGAKFVTFYGHSSSVSLAFDLDRKDSYDNYDQMPLLVALGCSAGNLNIPGKSLGEVYVGYEKGGYIGLWSSTHYAFISSLSVVGENFYKHALNNKEGLRLGTIIKNTLNESAAQRRVTEQMMYMGDPALKFAIPDGPDPALDVKSISHSPERINISTDSLELQFVITNLGSVTEDKVSVELEHTYPDGKKRVIELDSITVPDFKDTILINIAIDSSMAGFNYYNLILNRNKELKEWPESTAYDNNDLKSLGLDKGYEVYIHSKTVTAVYPMDYAIVPDKEVEIVLSGSPYVQDSILVEIEMDTTRLFNSPLKLVDDFMIKGGSTRWQVPMELEEERVYYWRVRAVDESREDGGSWEDRSFVYVQDKTGWNQSHYYQFLDNEYENLLLKEDRVFVQDSFIYSWYVENKLKEDNQGLVIYYNGEKLNQGYFWLPDFSGAYVILSNNKTGNIDKFCPPGGQYGAINTRNYALYSFPFDLSIDSSRVDFMNFVENVIEEEYYVILILHYETLEDTFINQEWQKDSLDNNGKNIFNILEAQGAKKIRELGDEKESQYVFMFQKGVQALSEEFGATKREGIGVGAEFLYPEKTALMKSINIHHFKKFYDMEYSIEIQDSSDFHQVLIYPVNDTIPVMIDSTQLTANILGVDSLNTMGYESYKLAWMLENEDLNSLPQIVYWRFYGDLIGDYLLSAGDKLLKLPSEINNFDSLTLDFYVQNISHAVLETGIIEIKLLDETNNELYTERNDLTESIASFDSLYQERTIYIDTKSKKLRLQIELIVPEAATELYKNNNTLIKDYDVLQDDIAPFISVYFDGDRISNGEIVSNRCIIEVEVVDKSEVMPLSDPDNIFFSLLDPDRQLMDYDFTSKSVEFVPANPHTAYVKIQGDFKKVGLYTFSINARDRTGNKAGEVGYMVQFRIVSENAISYFTNYPNPSNNDMRFKYTLTTADSPPAYIITIFNIRGEVVEILTEKDLGALRVGTHSTESFNVGNLPAGLYLYKVDLQTDKPYDHINGPYDQYFKGQWGKMIVTP